MHDLRLVGVHEDGEHLILTDTQGGRFTLPIDEALRAAVRRDRAHLGQLQIEIDGGLRPRDVQARIRAGRSAEEVAALAGWSVEKVRRYEGPVLAEREHVAQLARAVPVRRRGAESATLGTLVHRRLSARGVDTDRVVWDAWRPEDSSWVVALTFAAGGRERQACWHVDLLARTVDPADDEARWLSADEPDPSAGPLVGSSVGPMHAGRAAGAQAGDAAGATHPGLARGGSVYDIEADGGVTAEPRRAGEGGPLDLVGAMRSRRREREGASRLANAARRRAPHGVTSGRVESTGDQASDVPGGAHPAGRRRSRPEPLELDPTLMDDPPAAHPAASQVSAREGAAPPAGARLGQPDSADTRPATKPEAPTPGLPAPMLVSSPVVSSPVVSSPVVSSPVVSSPVVSSPVVSSPVVSSPVVSVPHVPSSSSERTGSSNAGRWPLAESMRRSGTGAGPGSTSFLAGEGTGASEQPSDLDAGQVPDADPTSADPTSADPTSADPTSADPTSAEMSPNETGPNQVEPGQPQGLSPDLSGRHRGTKKQAARRARRPGVPSWDDIMFGTKRD